jgi:peptidoglycan/LPS O-acetylase OafA/YrhL
MPYRPDVDGLRAVAVLSVLLFHARVPGFSGGFVGVDVFCVISGFLITSITVREIKDGSFSLAAFYERRARRILPALFVTVLVSWMAAALLYMPPEFASFSASVAATATFVSNIVFWNQSGYFAGPAEIKPLLHVWSLAVEEQYYLLFPPALMVFARRGRNAAFGFIGIVFLISFAVGVWATIRAPGAAFYLTPARAWELMLGAMLAFDGIPGIGGDRIANCAGVLGLGMIAWAVAAFSSATPFPGWNAAIPCVGTALLLHSGGSGRTVTARLLRIKPLVFVGLISYSLYLFHWPLLAVARYFWIAPLPPWAGPVLLGIAGVAAALSWRFVEQPFRARSRITRRQVFSAGAVASAVAITAGLGGYLSDGIPARFPAYAHLD